MDKHIKIAILSIMYCFLIHAVIWSSLGMAFIVDRIFPPDPVVSVLPNKAKWVDWGNGTREYLHKRGGGVEFAPSDEG